eukprot:c29801_g1_i1.p1 GENE.c29801_g1_i1~~c29801_g1_i1.p1  ORF type:complete len:110 (+),score=42.89 c29801_g1_i1:34-363(+)
MSAPRVTGNMLQGTFQNGQSVRLVGKVLSSNNAEGQAVILSPDNIEIFVQRRDGQPYSTEYVEVIGTIQGPNTIEENSYCPFSDGFDLEAYGQAVELAFNQYGHLFRPE